jgi:hypothetical protein
MRIERNSFEVTGFNFLEIEEKTQLIESGFLSSSAEPAMLDPFTPCRQATSEMSLWPFLG